MRKVQRLRARKQFRALLMITKLKKEVTYRGTQSSNHHKELPSV